MGLCRGLSVLLGISAVDKDVRLFVPALTAAVIVTVFITAVAQLAREETHPRHVLVDAWVPPAVLTIGFVVFTHLAPQVPFIQRPAVTLSYAAALVLAVGAAVHITLTALPGNTDDTYRVHAALKRIVPQTIGQLISALLLLQAAFVFASGTTPMVWVLGCGLVCLWPVNRLLARVFYAS
jgi:hypothetical protein